jgi:hypothetical protein
MEGARVTGLTMRIACAAAVAAGVAWAPSPRLPAQGLTYVVVITGVGGEPKYTQAFTSAATSFLHAVQTRGGVPDSTVYFLAEKADGPEMHRVRGVANKANVESAFAEIARRATVSDQLFVMLIGHGSGTEGDARFNLVGPDMTAADFAKLLAAIPTKRVAFVNASSASGEFVKALSAPGRVVVTATKSGFERNESVFARYFVAAYATDGADADKDGRVSVLEAFDYARREVARSYEQDKRLLTEHAQLDDNGDGTPTAEPTARTPDGGIARAFFVGGGASAVASNDPRLAPLLEQKARWEAKVDSLRRKKASMDAATYDRELETALLELAKVSEAIRTAQPEKKP